MKYCDYGTGSTTGCDDPTKQTLPRTPLRFSFHQCNWDDKRTDQFRCYSRGSNLEEGICRISGGGGFLEGEGCGDGTCNLSKGETKTSCRDDCDPPPATTK